MNQRARDLRYFFFSQYVSDGFRVTIEILLPALVFAYFDHFKTGLALSLGALCLSICDTPGPVHHKRNAMFASVLCIFFISLITALARMNFLLLSAEILFVTFFLSMFTVYGARAGAVGSAGILIMILTLDDPVTPMEGLAQSGLLVAGGLWYMIVALLLYSIRPYRPAQRALGECIRATAKFLEAKADLYDTRIDLEIAYRKIVTEQVNVSEKQDAVRELLFKTRQIVKETTPTGRALLLTFSDSVDLYEQIMSVYYDYSSLRERFGATGVLTDISSLIKEIAAELDNAGFSIQANLPYKSRTDLEEQFIALKRKADAIVSEGSDHRTLVLKRIMVNLRTIAHRVGNIHEYIESKEKTRKRDLDYARFVSHDEFNFNMMKDNFTFDSSVFRHSLRVALACLFGFLLIRLLHYGEHSYWVLLTITVIMKPAFSLTRKRNIERITGTIAGGMIGVLVLLFIKDKTALLVLLIIFMLGTYIFQRLNYIVMVICVTPFVMILFKFSGIGPLSVIEERILDTVIGCAIAFTASYVLFPRWESELLSTYMRQVLKANLAYMEVLCKKLRGNTVNTTDYKVVRKEVYVSSANLAAAFQRMLSEPRSKQSSNEDIYQFVVLNHTLSSNIATLSSAITGGKPFAPVYLRPVDRSITALRTSLKKLDPSRDQTGDETVNEHTNIHEQHDDLVKEQLNFIQKVSTDIGKVTHSIVVSSR